MFQLPTQLLSIVLERANVQAIIVIKQDDDDTDWEIINDAIEDPGDSTLSSNIDEADWNNGQEVLHPDQAYGEKTVRTTRVLLLKQRSLADTVIAHRPLPNLQPPVGAIALPLLERQMSTIGIFCEFDIIQAPPLPKDGRAPNIPQPKAGRDHNVPQHQKATSKSAKWFMEAIVVTKTLWWIISDEKYLMVDEAWILAVEAQDCQPASADAPGGGPIMWQLPGGLFLKINSHTREAVSVYSVFSSLIGLMIILNPRNINTYN